MVASRKTIEEVYRVLLRHLDADTISRILEDLKQVEGNQSFEQTVALINILHRPNQQEETLQKFWMGHVGSNDDFGKKIATVFYDGKTRMGPWAIMSPASWLIHGVGQTGTGFAQKYSKQADGRWLKVEG